LHTQICTEQITFVQSIIEVAKKKKNLKTRRQWQSSKHATWRCFWRKKN